MQLNRFAKQTELAEVFKLYLTAYEKLSSSKNPWPIFNDFQVIKAEDDAGVFYSPEAAIFGNLHAQSKESALGKNIANRLVDCAAYFLAQNITPEEVPDTVRLCLAVCHENEHWTGVKVTVENFKQNYEQLHEEWIKNPADLRSGEPDTLINKAKNFIVDNLSLMLDPPHYPENEDEKTQLIIKFFQKQQQPMLIEHYDSINSAYYNSRIERSLNNIKNLVNLKAQPCSQQQGNTCGDHTTINLFGAGFFKAPPVINGGGFLDSKFLRDITDKKNAGPSIITDVIKSLKFNYENLNSFSYNLSDNEIVKKCNDLANNILTLINQLHAIDPTTTTAVVHQAIYAASKGTVVLPAIEAPESNEIYLKLIKLFVGKDVCEKDPIAYGSLAILIAKDYCTDIESNNLLEQQEKEFQQIETGNLETPADIPIAVQIQQHEQVLVKLKEKIITTIEEFNKNKQPQRKNVWPLGWAGSRSHIFYGTGDYRVPQTIKFIYDKIAAYETIYVKLDERERLKTVQEVFLEISKSLETKAKNQNGMMNCIIMFFKRIVSEIFGYGRKEETIKTYNDMKDIIDQSNMVDTNHSKRP